MQVYGTADIARIVTERTGCHCTQDKARAALRKADIGRFVGNARIVDKRDLERAVKVISESKVGNPLMRAKAKQ